MGRYERLEGTDEAEVAFVVTDAYQRRGIGALLLDHLADAARSHGIARFHGPDALGKPGHARRLLLLGLPGQASSEGGTVTVRFPIEPGGAYARARELRSAPPGSAGPSATGPSAGSPRR